MRNEGKLMVAFEVRDGYSTVFERKSIPLEDAIKQLQRFDALKGSGREKNGNGKKNKGKSKKKANIFSGASSFDVSLSNGVSVGSTDSDGDSLEQEFSSIFPKSSKENSKDLEELFG